MSCCTSSSSLSIVCFAVKCCACVAVELAVSVVVCVVTSSSLLIMCVLILMCVVCVEVLYVSVLMLMMKCCAEVCA
jgi:hypothetical protein